MRLFSSRNFRRLSSKKFFQKTIDKIKIVCYNLVTRLKKQPN